MQPRNPYSLAGKTALVVGASRGIGLAIAELAAAQEARTILAARSLDKLEEHAARLRGQGLQAETLRLDVAAPETFVAALAPLPEIDILINVAGMNIRKRVGDFTPDDYARLMDTNLHGIFEVTRAVGGKMIARGQGGKIVNIGSLMSVLGLPYMAVYAMAKSGLAGMTRALAAEWGRYGIQVNCVAPGFVITDLNREIWKRPELHAWYQGLAVNPRLGKPEDVAGVTVFLASAAADYVTGQVIAVDGGYSTAAMWPFEP